jgi:hypothetical protein
LKHRELSQMGRLESNAALLRRIYSGEGPEGIALVPSPRLVSIFEHPDYDFTISEKPVRNWLAWVVENHRREVEMLELAGGHVVPCARILTGTHIYAAAFGCEVHRSPDANPCALPLVSSAAEAERLQQPDIWKSPVLYRIFELAEAVRNELGSDVCLGPPDMQSGFDTAALVWDKTGFLCAMADDEEKGAVKRLVAKCAGLFKSFLLEFRREFPGCSPCHCPRAWAPPEMPPWLSNDECGAFSTADFEEFCLPELIDLSGTFGGLGMHCCADAEHQFASFRKIPGFYAFNRVAARRGYLPLLERLSGRDAPVHVLSWREGQDLRDLIAAAPGGTRFIMVLGNATAETAKPWLASMRALSESRRPAGQEERSEVRAEVP